MPSSAVPQRASRVWARAGAQHPRPNTRQPLQPRCFNPLPATLSLQSSPRNRPRSRRDGHHTRSLHAARPWPRALLPGASSWHRGGAWAGPGRLSGVCMCMPMPMPTPMCRVCTCACSERIPPSASGVAAALAQRADARRHRARAADGRAGALAGHSTLCLSRCSLPQGGLQPAAEPGAEPGAGRVRGHSPQPQPAPQHALPCRPALSPAEAQTANSSPGDACRWLIGRGMVLRFATHGAHRALPSSPCRLAGGLSSSRRPSRSCSRAHCDLEERITLFTSCRSSVVP